MNWTHYGRIAASIAVIVIHVTHASFWNGPTSGFPWIIGLAYDSASRWCVPLFIVISGFLLANKSQSYSKFIKQRLSRICIPLIFWSTFYLAWATYFPSLYLSEYRLQDSGISWFAAVLSGYPYYHLWFLYMILPLYLLTPLIHKLSSLIREDSVIAVFLAFISATWLMNTFDLQPWAKSSDGTIIALLIQNIPYFLLGVTLSKHPETLKKKALIYLFPLGLLLTIAPVCTLSRYPDFEMNDTVIYFTYCSPLIALMTIGVLAKLMTNFNPVKPPAWIERLSALTFGIYLTHPIVLDLLSICNINAETINPIIGVPVIVLFAFIASGVVTCAIKKVPALRRVC